MKPLVSVLIPVYNRENLVGETIESAMNQTYENIEIIIVDNCSTDKTWQVLQYYDALDKRVKIFRNNKNIGPVHNWKRCIDEAKGEYSKILFSDDLISENFLEESLKVFNDSVAFVLASIKRIRNKTYEKTKTNIKKSEFSTKEYLDNILFRNLYGFPVSPGSALFRTKDLNMFLISDIPNPLGLDFKRYGAGNDLLVFLYTAVNYKTIVIAKKATAWFRIHEGSLTMENDLNVYYSYTRFYFIKKYYSKYLSKYKTYIWMKGKKHKIDDPVYELIDKPLKYSYIISSIYTEVKKMKLKKSITNYL